MDRGGQSVVQAVRILPEPLRSRVLERRREDMARIEEIRLRVGQRPTLTLPEGERSLEGADVVTQETLEHLVQLASRWSLHTVLDQLCQGFITVEGGHRLGLCGRAVMQQGRIINLRDISSANLRIARSCIGFAGQLGDRLWEGEQLQNTLILAPPGLGKTTLLRDLIRAVSQGEQGPGLRVAVTDERGELAACVRGRPCMDLGSRTDVLEGCPKAQGMMLLLRGMNPQVLAVDEITAPEDVEVMEQAVGCGTVLLATAHGSGPEDLRRRPLYRSMMDKGIFRRLVTISVDGGVRNLRVETLEW